MKVNTFYNDVSTGNNNSYKRSFQNTEDTLTTANFRDLILDPAKTLRGKSRFRLRVILTKYSHGPFELNPFDVKKFLRKLTKGNLTSCYITCA